MFSGPGCLDEERFLGSDLIALYLPDKHKMPAVALS